ncbi:peptidase S8/S53 domain-containing protein [Hygrophoropsis aurantiaca]|uniref:Peptidase S8/S53 domain-containing protein n=1 Tax=Hygrophoropsis aurantiaca TaxID=72124 RepID=A0ACB8ARL1_9AGAM|nr:peptidase S8/S53 domain-containing protein [Hygrophoropsis aurantiaca]
MRSSLAGIVLLTLGLAANASPATSWTLHEKRSSIPEGWVPARKLDPSTSVPLRFALAQNNIQDIEKHLYDVSHPDSPNYGKHWTAGQVAKTFAPSPDTIKTVFEWLVSTGIEPGRVKVSNNKGWIEVTSSAEEAATLLRADYNVYAHDSGKEHVACESYHLPAHIAPHVDFVTPTIHFDAKLTKRSFGPAGIIGTAGKIGNTFGPKTTGESIGTIIKELKNCHASITPACLKALYGVLYEPVAGDKNSFALAEYTPNAFLQSDLDVFAKEFDTGLVGKPPQVISIDGGVVQTENVTFAYDSEADLDIEYASAILTDKQNVTVYQIGDLVEGASFNNFLDALDGTYCTFDGGDDPSYDAVFPDKYAGGWNGTEECGTVKPANVISSSYGYNEADLSLKYALRQCNEYGKLGLMGVTYVSGTGDSGVSGNGDLCLNPNGTQSTDGNRFNPTFPGTCPWVTAVGATQMRPNTSILDPEIACQDHFYSGGGFSNYFLYPDYQKSAVSGYLKNHPPNYPNGTFNTDGTRAYPDLSANGAYYAVYSAGKWVPTFGTSASTPVVAAILALINDARIAAGKSPIGFVNPMLYSDEFSHAFNDITNGTNPGCGTLGFNSTKGWDPVTGLGTPRFPILLAEWLSLA